MRTVIFLYFILLLLIVINCEKNKQPLQTIANNPHILHPEVRLTLDYAGVTETWIKLQIVHGNNLKSVEVYRDSTKIFSGNVRQDTVIYDFLLKPATQYKYWADLLLEDGGHNVTEDLEVTTMDTTSHEVQWEIYTFGGEPPSSLFDVVINDSKEIWAVGEIYIPNDTVSGRCFNAVFFKNNNWELKQVPFIGSCSAIDYPPLITVWCDEENTLFFSNGGSIVSYDEDIFIMDCGMNSLLCGAIKKIWKYKKNFFIVGNFGSIVYKIDNTWQKIESNTDVNLLDVWGTSHNNVWMCGYDTGYYNSILLRWDGEKIETIWEEANPNHLPYYSILSGLWAADDRYMFVVNNTSIFRHSLLNLNKVTVEPIHLGNAAEGIHGSGLNDIFVVGNDAMIWHYNGKSWHRYQELYNNYDTLLSVAVTKDKVCAVGYRYKGPMENYGVIYLGRR